MLERLPEKLDPSLAELKRMRAALRANPNNLDIAVRVARRSIEAARETGDPRFLGQAQAALAPWWTAADPPLPALLLRATVKQSQHDFPGALADLDRLLAARPADGQALLTRATVLTVQGRYADAQRDCAKLLRLASGLVTTACLAGASSLNGDAAGAYRGLVQALARAERGGGRARLGADAGGGNRGAARRCRRGRHCISARRWRSIRATPTCWAPTPISCWTSAARARWFRCSRTSTQNDALLLRLALAEKSLPEQAQRIRRRIAGSLPTALRRRGGVATRCTCARRRAFGWTIENDVPRRARAGEGQLERAARTGRPADPCRGGARQRRRRARRRP